MKLCLQKLALACRLWFTDPGLAELQLFPINQSDTSISPFAVETEARHPKKRPHADPQILWMSPYMGRGREREGEKRGGEQGAVAFADVIRDLEMLESVLSNSGGPPMQAHLFL